MITVVLSKVSQPSKKKKKSYVENFVTAECTCINDGATFNIREGRPAFVRLSKKVLVSGFHPVDSGFITLY